MKKTLTALFAAFLWLFTSMVHAADVFPPDHSLPALLKQLEEQQKLLIQNEKVNTAYLLPKFYRLRENRRVWESHPRLEVVLDEIEKSAAEGLNPEDYHLAELRAYQRIIDAGIEPTEKQRNEFDLLLTDALIQLAHHLFFGRANPNALHSDWPFTRELGHRSPFTLLEAAISPRVSPGFIEPFLPQLTTYKELKHSLEFYRSIQRQGGWSEVKLGPTLELGISNDRVLALRDRLLASRDFDASQYSDGELFDQALADAVTRFQRRHGLESDGKAGKKTLSAINIPVEKKIEAIITNLERLRWVQNDFQENFVALNIAGYNAYFIRDGQLIWESRTQVGKPKRRTPIFKSTIEHIIFNPSWTVPPTILEKDILPKVHADVGYLEKNNIEVVDRDGNVINQYLLDWTTFTSRRNFPYYLRQKPGKQNALGRIKFNFPNRYSVFMHDTPRKNLFEPSQRAFSSGCIRVEESFALAELLLETDHRGWSNRAIQKTIQEEKTKTIRLRKPITVMSFYWTVDVDTQGVTYFYPDIYNRDLTLLAELGRDFEYAPPNDIATWARHYTEQLYALDIERQKQRAPLPPIAGVPNAPQMP